MWHRGGPGAATPADPDAGTDADGVAVAAEAGPEWVADVGGAAAVLAAAAGVLPAVLPPAWQPASTSAASTVVAAAAVCCLVFMELPRTRPILASAADRTPDHAKRLRLIWPERRRPGGGNVRARWTGTATALALPLLLLAACSQAAGPASATRPVTAALCGSGPQARPGIVEVVCGTDDITARKLAWSDWGKPVTTATGTAVVDLCAMEDCHTGSFQAAPIVLIASGIRGCPRHRRAYSRLQYVFVGRSPFQGLPAPHPRTS